LAKYNNVTIGGLTAGLSNPISIGSQTISLSSLSSGIELDWGQDTHIKKYQVFEIEEDLLSLSCAWQRLRTAHKANPPGPYPGITRLLDKELFRHVTTDDRTRADQIRDYYSKKVMMWKLKNTRFTKYRDDMNEFVHSDGKKFKEEMCPLAYRLPEFYDYDSSFDQLMFKHNNKVAETITVGKKTLKLEKTFNVGKKYNKVKEYWFSDERDNLVNMSIEQSNILIPLLDSFVESPFTLEAIYSKKHKDDKEYIVANKFKFV
jgi:hypothetical protein